MSRELAPRRSGRVRLCFAGLMTTLLMLGGSVRADDVRLQNGMQFSGNAVPIKGLTNALAQQTEGPTNIYPILLIDTGMKRIYVPQRQVLDIVKADGLARFETFDIPQRKTGGGRMLQSLGGIQNITPFDRFGRRTVTLLTPGGPLNVVQGVTRITPEYLTVTGLTLAWEHGIPTTSVPVETLDAMLRQVTDPFSPNDRMAVARFYIQASLYPQAAAELAAIARDFPDFKDRVEEASQELRQLQARQLLGELRRRRAAGQHQLAFAAAREFPTQNMTADVLREVRELQAEYEAVRERRDTAAVLLGELPAELADASLQAAVKPLRAEVLAQLERDVESLERLDPFLKQADDPSRSADEKLALAYSGWVLGGGQAIDDLPATLRLWEARFQILQVLRTADVNRRKPLEAELLNLEGIGPETVARLIPWLPALLETPDLQPGLARRIELPADGNVRGAYWVLLPTEYPVDCRPQHKYPLIVALRPAERTETELLEWWGGTVEQPGQSQRHGYIVIAPEYAERGQRAYTGEAAARQMIVECIRDARKRFAVDSDRVFLSGHGMGGDAAFDIGMTHPDLFAGVIPVTGITPDICKWYLENAKRLSWYVVGGELDRDSLNQNATVLNRMLRYGYDVVYVEYIGRGYESYYSEIHHLFDWMEGRRRTRHVEEVDAKIKRPHDNRHFWIEAVGLPASLLTASKPMILNARVTPGNTIYVSSGGEPNVLWLSPEFVDFDRRVSVRAGGRQRFNDFLRPNVLDMLEDLRIRGDREKLYWVKLVID